MNNFIEKKVSGCSLNKSKLCETQCGCNFVRLMYIILKKQPLLYQTWVYIYCDMYIALNQLQIMSFLSFLSYPIIFGSIYRMRERNDDKEGQKTCIVCFGIWMDMSLLIYVHNIQRHLFLSYFSFRPGILPNQFIHIIKFFLNHNKQFVVVFYSKELFVFIHVSMASLEIR